MLLPASSHSTPEGTLGFLRTQFEKDSKVQRRKFQEQSLVCRFFFFFWSSVCLHQAFTAAGGFLQSWQAEVPLVAVLLPCMSLLQWFLSLIAKHGLQGAWALVFVPCGFSSCDLRALEHMLSSCASGAQLLPGMWDLLRLGLELVFLALASRFLSTMPPGKSFSSGAFPEITQSLIQNSKPKPSKSRKDLSWLCSPRRQGK